MKLSAEFIRLPLHIDATTLAREVERLPEAAWRPHPQGFSGNSALALVAVGGDANDDGLVGPMRPTSHLATCPYLTQVLGALSATVGRTRLMRLEGNAEATSHSDISYYWFRRARVHVPVVTHPDVSFHCGARMQHMAAGEAWVFDTWRPHRVVNPRPTLRIHLVADTVGSAAFWDMLDAENDHTHLRVQTRREVVFDPGAAPSLRFESWNWPRILPAAELDAIVAQICGALREAEPAGATLKRTLLGFTRDWRDLWACHGDSGDGLLAYQRARDQLLAELDVDWKGSPLDNDVGALAAVRELLVRPLLTATDPKPAEARRTDASEWRAPASVAPAGSAVGFDRPVFIVCPPRSGSSLLFETLAQSPDLWTIGGESHQTFESLSELHPSSCGFDSNRLGAEDASADIVARLKAAFLRNLRDRDQAVPPSAGSVRLLEKTPKNSLRVPFLATAFPDACFVYLYRDPRETLSSMLDAWRSGGFITYPTLPGWQDLPWSLLLTPGWRELIGRPLAEIVAQQWSRATEMLLDDLEALPPGSWCVAAYDRLISEPQAEVEHICDFVNVRWDRGLAAPLPLSHTTLSAPAPDKWKHNAGELEAMLPLVRETAARARQLFARPPLTRPVFRVAPEPGRAVQREAPDYRSVHTQSFASLLKQLGVTLIVTTYQSGGVVLVRADGDQLNTHVRAFPNPMGVAVGPGRLSLGTEREILECFDVPAVAAQLEHGAGTDAVYVPRNSAITGDIRVHELAYAGGELWVTNTRFSTLCTLDREHSFVPRWRPPFVTALAPEDRCHLNGLCVVDDRVRFVTALGATDVAGGWRAGKAAGGCIVEVPSGRIVAGGLSMPHSPRWHAGALWVLESGKGEIGVVEPRSRTVEPRARLEGFTRGLAFAGPYAFIGVSHGRENVFGGMPLADRVPQRPCGVWVVDVRDGTTVAFLRFEGTVQEIFDVQFLPARFADLLEPGDELVGSTYALPPAALGDVPAHLQATPRVAVAR